MSELKKAIGPWSMIALGTAGVIGSMWLYLGSKFFAAFGAGGTILGMALGTLLAFCVAKAYSELASRFPRAGGEIVYAYVAGGSTLSFIVGWLLIGAYGGMVAFYVAAAGELLTTVFPGLETIPLYTVGGETVYAPILAIGVTLTLLILVLNWFGISIGAIVQLVLFVVMLGLGIVVSVVGFGAGHIENLVPAFDPNLQEVASPPLAVIAFLLPAFAFLSGFGVVAVLAEEVNAPAKLLGKIVGWSVLLAGGFYVVVLTATAFVIPWRETAALKNGTIEAFEVAGFPTIALMAFLIGVLGIITTFIAVFAASSRLMLALARVKLLPPFFGKVHEETRVPRNALLSTTAIGLGLGWLGPGALTWLLNVGGVYIGVVWAITVWCFYRVRKTHRDVEPPYKVRFAWVPAFGALAALIVILGGLIPGLPLSLKWPFEYLIFIGWVLLGFLLYWFSPRTGSKEEHLNSLLGDNTAH